jgi:hypothetical protein
MRLGESESATQDRANRAGMLIGAWPGLGASMFVTTRKEKAPPVHVKRDFRQLGIRQIPLDENRVLVMSDFPDSQLLRRQFLGSWT